MENDKTELMRQVGRYVVENDELQRKHGLRAVPRVHYERRRVPVLGRLGLWLLRVTGAKLEINYTRRVGA